MTRRIRFTPLLAAGCFLALPAARAAEVPFVTRPPVSTSITSANGLTAADLDGDGDGDLLATRFGGLNAVFAIENTNGDGSAWTTRTIADTPFGANAVFAADLDGDGDLDALTSDLETSTPFWIENGTGATWTPRSMNGFVYTATFLAPADVDRDGDTGRRERRLGHARLLVRERGRQRERLDAPHPRHRTGDAGLDRAGRRGRGR
jgi:hypothetical protein